MSRKKSKPKNSGRINRRQETIDKRSLGSQISGVSDTRRTSAAK